jgi:hypothetical protein
MVCLVEDLDPEAGNSLSFVPCVFDECEFSPGHHDLVPATGKLPDSCHVIDLPVAVAGFDLVTFMLP